MLRIIIIIQAVQKKFVIRCKDRLLLGRCSCSTLGLAIVDLIFEAASLEYIEDVQEHGLQHLTSQELIVKVFLLFMSYPRVVPCFVEEVGSLWIKSRYFLYVLDPWQCSEYAEVAHTEETIHVIIGTWLQHLQLVHTTEVQVAHELFDILPPS